jgi:hypothetical protein
MTSDSESVQKNPITPNTAQETSAQTSQSNPNISATSSVSTPPPAEAHCQITCKTEKTPWDKFKDGAEIVGICFLAVYAWYTIKMYCANKQAADAATSAAKSAEGANRIAQLSERAWFGSSNVEVELPRALRKGEKVPLVGELFVVRVFFDNAGKTPALNAKIATQGFIAPIEAGPHGEKAILFGMTEFRDSDYQVVGSVPPDFKVHRDIPVWSLRTTSENQKAILAPTHRAVVQGRGTYCDVANPKVTHWFTFCFYYVPDQGFSPYPRYNDLGDEDKPCHAE